MTDPALYYDNNTVRGYRFLETVRAADITRRIIFSSSCSVYGVAPARPIAETAPLLPISTYGWSKLLFERMLADFHRAYGFESVSLRYFNAAGADPDGDLGEAHDPEPHILPLMLQAASRSEPRITLNGNDHETPDGFCVRDFVHVSDIAEAHVLALGRLLQNPPGPAVYNLGSGRGQSLKQLAGAVQRITGRTLELEIGPRRAGDPPFAVADSGLAERELGWKQHYSDLDSIVDSAWRWMSRTVSAAAGEVPSRDAPAKKQ
jgi:UDP-arabinose 4-epimerase